MARSLELEEVISWQPGLVEGWQRMQAKRAFSILLGKMLQNESEGAFDEQVPYLKAMHVQWDGIIWDDLPKMWAAPQEINALNVTKGDLLVCEGGDVGRAAIVKTQPEETTIIQNALHLVRGSERGDVRFLAYCLRNAADQGWFDVLCNRSTIAHFTVEKFRELWLCLPPLPTQHRIADYLDAETQRIDELIAAKRSMLALLEKKRAALVSQAVTQGLNPKVKMKDSGLEWLGEIPEHWGVMRLGYLFSMQGGSTPSKANEDYWKGTIPWATPKDIKRPVLDDTIDHVSDEVLTETGLTIINPPVVLIVVRGMILARRIPTALTAVPMTINQDMKALTPNSSLIKANYLKLVFDGVQSAMIPLIEEAGHGTKVLRTDLLTTFKIPLPSLEHQQEILDGLEDYNKSSVRLERELDASITLLAARRSALITAAVTGQLSI